MSNRMDFYPDGELLLPLTRQIKRAAVSVDMAYFYWKTLYSSGYLEPNDVLDAVLMAARKEGVRVRVLLGYGADVPSIQYLNYLTAKQLEAGGVEVRLAPTNRTTHVKMTIIDGTQVFIGSHNITHGAFGENAEATVRLVSSALAGTVEDYYETLWQAAVTTEEIPPPPPPEEDEGGESGYFPPPLAPALTVHRDADSTAAILEWTPAPEDFFGQYEIHKATEPGVTDESPLLVTIHDSGLSRYADRNRSPLMPAYYRLYLFNSRGVSDGSAEVLLPPDGVPQIVLTGVVNENNALVCSFTVDSRNGITAIAALSSPNADLSNATKGPEFDHTVSQAWVTPQANANDTVYVAVAAYADGVEIARSNILSIVYEPVTPPPPPTLTPPVLVSVTQIGPMGINVEYSHVTPADFARYEVQQRTNGSWQTLATITTPETRSWSGGPIPYMDAQHPVRVVVFVQSGDSAASNEMAITPM